MPLPFISVNIPIKPKGNPTSALESIKNVDYPTNFIEIVSVEGNHIAKQRNFAIKHSKGDIVYLLDDDSQIKPASFKMIVKYFRNKKVAAVGGPSLPKKNGNYLNFLIGTALETYFGAMRMRFRYSEQPQQKDCNEYQLIGANLALRKKAVEKIGMFDEKIVPNEETELLRRLKQAKYRLIYDRNLSITRQHRKTLKDLSSQFQHYGIGRMKQILYNGNLEDLIFIIPVVFVFYLLSLVLFHPNWYLVPMTLYLLLSLVTSCKAGLKYRKFDLVFILPLIFLTIHISYALGLIKELVEKLTSTKRKTVANKMKLKIIKLNHIDA